MQQVVYCISDLIYVPFPLSLPARGRSLSRWYCTFKLWCRVWRLTCFELNVRTFKGRELRDWSNESRASVLSGSWSDYAQVPESILLCALRLVVRTALVEVHLGESFEKLDLSDENVIHPQPLSVADELHVGTLYVSCCTCIIIKCELTVFTHSRMILSKTNLQKISKN